MFALSSYERKSKKKVQYVIVKLKIEKRNCHRQGPKVYFYVDMFMAASIM
jgi:hypothetical protein